MGLYHTTESFGNRFDPVADTVFVAAAIGKLLKLDEQRMNEWKELLEAQQRQIEKLDRIATKLGCEA